MWTVSFWKQTAERAVKTFGQAALSALGVNALGLVEVPWLQVLDIAALAGVISVLTSVVSGGVNTGEPTSPSLVSTTQTKA